MPKQAMNINFSEGLDTKTDPYQISGGKFLSLVNSVFTVGKRLTKRNGFGPLASLPYASSYLTTFNEDLTAVGSHIQAYSSESKAWTSVASFAPCNVETLPIVRRGTSQSQVDSAVAPNGLICVVWTDQNPSSLSTNQFKYAVYDSTTGQQIIAPATITANVTYGFPRVFVLGNNFIIGYILDVAAVYNLYYIAVGIYSLAVTSPVSITASITPSAGIPWDAAVLNNALYFAWVGGAASGIKMLYLTSALSLSSTINPDTGADATGSTQLSVCSDSTNQVVFATYYNASSHNGRTVGVNPSLNVLTGFPTGSISATVVANTTSCVSTPGTLNIYIEVVNAYSYDSAVPSNFINLVTVAQSNGAPSGQSGVSRSLGLASKAFVIEGVPYYLGSYTSPFQPTFFLMNGTNNLVVAELAYQNGGGYLTHGLPSVSINGQLARVSYLIKDFIQAVSNANDAGTVVVGGIYTQTGINQATFTMGDTAKITTAEIGSNLNISAGMLWGYDGTQATEQGFFLYPDSVESTSQPTTGGSITAGIYYYIVIYEWVDNRGNIFRSAGSLPIKVDISASMTSTNRIILQGPNLRLTYKSNATIKIYRSSAALPIFYYIQSTNIPLMNTSSDSWSYTDSVADASLAGSEILYTTGGVLDNIGGPSFTSVFTYDNRLWGIDSEDRNLLWFSKPVIESTPVEMSDLQTLFVSPSIGAQGSTGDLTCGAQMDDKAILFKNAGMYYINGTGPDITGANNGYGQPTFITSMVGCSNQASIVFQPQGLMFEFASEAGNQIWLLGRDLSTKYIGAEVESITKDATVTSAVAIPGTNQVRFSLSSGITIMYDYFYGQWGQFSTNALSSTLFEGQHTYIDSRGSLFQETPGQYLDGTTPVIMSFQTGWLNVAGIRGYERIHEFSFLGTYYSPHKLAIQVAYDYGSPSHQSMYLPLNFATAYGGDPLYGDGNTYGGPSPIEQFRVHAKQQKCKAFQISLQEIYDPSFGVAAGAGLSLSGVNLVMSVKKAWSPVAGKNSVG